MPTLVTVPPPTGAKSHASGPVVLLMVLEGGVVVCAEAVGALRNRNKVADARSRKARETKVRKRASRMKPPRECAQGAAKHLEFFVNGMRWFLAAGAEIARAGMVNFYGPGGGGAIRGVPELGIGDRPA